MMDPIADRGGRIAELEPNKRGRPPKGKAG